MASVTHGCVFGPTGCGKSSLASYIASEAASTCFTIIIDPNKFYRNVRRMHERHRFIRFEHLRLGLWDAPDGVPLHTVDSTINHELTESLGAIYGEYELSEVVEKQRKRGTPCLPDMLRDLRNKVYKGYTKRGTYRDSILLVLQGLYRTTGDVFNCSKGMNLEDILLSNVVLEIDGILPEYQAMFIRYVFEFLHLLTLSGRKPEKPIVLILDEGQIIFRQRNLQTKIVLLRHHGIHLLVNVQNCSLCPVEMTSNSDLLISFSYADWRDRNAFSKCANLTVEQTAALARLDVSSRQYCCVLPRSNWKYPFIATVPFVEFQHVSDDVINRQSQEFAQRFDWMPIEEDKGFAFEDSDGGDKFNQQVRNFLNDVLNKVHEFSRLTNRWQRAGVRSAATQNRMLKQLIAQGYIRVWDLAVNSRGAPIKLVEPTDKAFEEYGVSWKASGRGVLPTRAASDFVFEKLNQIKGWQVVKEGVLEDKQVDLLCRDLDNRVVTVEIANSPGHEVHNAMACLLRIAIGSNHLGLKINQV